MKCRTISKICLYFLCFSFFFGGIPMKASAAETATVESVLLQDINELRAYYGRQPLVLDGTLCYDAQVRAQEITTCFSHTRPDGTPWYYVDYYRMYGETLAMGYSCTESGVHGIVDLWMDSPSHAAMLLNSDFRTVGFSACLGADGNWYWAAELGY